MKGEIRMDDITLKLVSKLSMVKGLLVGVYNTLDENDMVKGEKMKIILKTIIDVIDKSEDEPV